MGSAFHQLCPRYSGTLTPTAPTAIRLWETFTFFTRFAFHLHDEKILCGKQKSYTQRQKYSKAKDSVHFIASQSCPQGILLNKHKALSAARL